MPKINLKVLLFSGLLVSTQILASTAQEYGSHLPNDPRLLNDIMDGLLDQMVIVGAGIDNAKYSNNTVEARRLEDFLEELTRDIRELQSRIDNLPASQARVMTPTRAPQPDSMEYCNDEQYYSSETMPNEQPEKTLKDWAEGRNSPVELSEECLKACQASCINKYLDMPPVSQLPVSEEDRFIFVDEYISCTIEYFKRMLASISPEDQNREYYATQLSKLVGKPETDSFNSYFSKLNQLGDAIRPASWLSELTSKTIFMMGDIGEDLDSIKTNLWEQIGNMQAQGVSTDGQLKCMAEICSELEYERDIRDGKVKNPKNKEQRLAFSIDGMQQYQWSLGNILQAIRGFTFATKRVWITPEDAEAILQMQPKDDRSWWKHIYPRHLLKT